MPDFGETIFRRLSGAWSLEREIPGFGSMAGTATFLPESDSVLLYRETVQVLTEQGARFDGRRAYRYRLSDGTIVVCFADAHRDGEVYVSLTFSQGADRATAECLHRCDQDLYRHRMTWIGNDRFMTEITVTGPRKDHCLVTQYRRTAPE